MLLFLKIIYLEFLPEVNLHLGYMLRYPAVASPFAWISNQCFNFVFFNATPFLCGALYQLNFSRS